MPYQRVTERHGAAVDVELVQVRPQRLGPGQRHARKSLIHLIQVHLINGEAGVLQYFLRGGNRSTERHNDKQL